LTAQRIVFCGSQYDVACDRRCDKAWGINMRPRHDEGRFLADCELDDAPADPGTYEGMDAKPPGPSWQGSLNRWCVRECERCVMVAAGAPIKLRTW